MGAPEVLGRIFRIVRWKIVFGYRDGQAAVFVSEIFLGQGLGVIFKVAADKELPLTFGGDNRNAGVLRFGEDFKLRRL